VEFHKISTNTKTEANEAKSARKLSKSNQEIGKLKQEMYINYILKKKSLK
jgi:hypothetical protein